MRCAAARGPRKVGAGSRGTDKDGLHCDCGTNHEHNRALVKRLFFGVMSKLRRQSAERTNHFAVCGYDTT